MSKKQHGSQLSPVLFSVDDDYLARSILLFSH
jgi:hypothetical protein